LIKINVMRPAIAKTLRSPGLAFSPEYFRHHHNETTLIHRIAVNYSSCNTSFAVILARYSYNGMFKNNVL